MGMEQWQQIKTEYITTDTSYRKLANKYGIHYKRIAEKAKAEGWVKERNKYRNKVVTKAVTKRANCESTKLAKLMTTTEKAIDVLAKTFEDENQFHRHLIQTKEKYGKNETWDVKERTYDKVDTKALKEAVTAMKDLTSMMRDYYNIPTAAQAEAQRIAAERLEIEKKRANAEEVDNNIQVIMDGELEEWSK